MSTRNRMLTLGVLVLALGMIVFFVLSVNVGASASPEAAPPVYYVDAAVTASGDGSNWGEAFKTIGEATAKPLDPGSIIWVRPGTYREDVALNQSGAQIVPMTTGVQTLAGSRVVFPPGAELSGIDLAAHPGERFINQGWGQVADRRPVFFAGSTL